MAPDEQERMGACWGQPSLSRHNTAESAHHRCHAPSHEAQQVSSDALSPQGVSSGSASPSDQALSACTTPVFCSNF